MRSVVKRSVMVHLLWIVMNTTGYAGSSVDIALEKVRIDPHDKASIVRGARFFKNNCMACHSMKYLDHDTVAKTVGMTIKSMPLKASSAWLIPPPDLSVIARVRGAPWLYTYLVTFYDDPDRAERVNNLLVKNTAMPNPFLGMQGRQVLRKQLQASNASPRWFTLLERVEKGAMSDQAFERHIQDLVTFLVYASDPHRPDREQLGLWVLGYLFVFWLLTICLKRAYWKD